MSKITIIEGNSNDKDNVRVLMVKGEKGYSAYDLYVQNGGTLTEEQWLDEFLNADNFYNKSEIDAKNDSQDQELLDEATERGNADSDLQDQITINTNDITNIKAEQITQNNLIAKKPYYFNTVADMKAYNLASGDLAITKGYYSANDGGGASYNITNTQSNSEIQESLTNSLYANLIIQNNEINFRQLGAKPQDTNNTFIDCKPYMDKFIALVKASSRRINLYIPSGCWYFSPTHLLDSGYQYGTTIRGDSDFQVPNGTVITSYSNNQDFVWYMGNENANIATATNMNLKDLAFSSMTYQYNSSSNKFVKGTDKTIARAVLICSCCCQSIYENLMFAFIKGCALEYNSSWENSLNKMMFIGVINPTGGVVTFPSNIKGQTSSCTLDNIEFELVKGHLFLFKEHSSFVNSTFNNINFEDNPSSDDRHLVSDGTFNINTASHWSMFKFENNTGSNITYAYENFINCININNLATFYYTDNGIQYIYDTIFDIGRSVYFQYGVNNINLLGQLLPINILNKPDGVNCNPRSTFYLGSYFANYDTVDESARFNVNGFRRIETPPYLKLKGYKEQYNEKNPFLVNMIPLSILTIQRFEYDIQPLYYDDASLTNNSLVVKMKNTSVYGNMQMAQFYKFKDSMTKLQIRAKIPNGVDYNIQLVGKSITTGQSVTYTKTLTGTGNYEWYTLDRYDNFEDFNNDIPINITTNTNHDYCYMDCIRCLD